jgi:hypothetical protein
MPDNPKMAIKAFGMDPKIVDRSILPPEDKASYLPMPAPTIKTMPKIQNIIVFK